LTDSVRRTIDLQNVRAITILPSSVRRYALAIVFSEEAAMLMALDSDTELLSWQTALQSTCLPLSRPLTAPVGMDLLSCASESTTQDVFNVYLLPNLSLSINGECLLQCTTETLYLLDVEDPKRRIIGWPLNTLRRYGRDHTKFTFECGRSCPTGEGIFIFNTIYGEQIYQKVHSASIAISQAYRFSTSSQPTIPLHRPLARTGTMPILPPREENAVDGIPVVLPPRRATVRRGLTMDSRRALPPLPPPPGF
jgi:docking protein 4/5/6